ncbi:MAG: FliO/MopB family protein [Bradymonadia bacterium]
MHRNYVHALVTTLMLLMSVAVAHANRIESASFHGGQDRLEFRLKTNEDVAGERISARTDGAVLVVTVDGADVKRRWVSLKDVDVKRALLHPSRDGQHARLRVRFHQPLTTLILQNIRVRKENADIVIAIPRDEATARFWAGEQPSKVATPAAKTVTQPAKPVAMKPQTPVEQPKANPAAPVAAAAETAKTPEDARTQAKVAREKSETPDEPVAQLNDIQPADSLSVDAKTDEASATNALGQAAPEGPRMGALAMAMLFLMCIALVVMRKFKKSGLTGDSGPMIRPVSSHMLGPKQSLLLVDVAGDMVLLGTGDKGIQMLTKIEGRDHVDPAELAAKVTPSSTKVPSQAMTGATGPAFAERFGRALGKIRAATGQNQAPAGQYNAYQSSSYADISDAQDHLAQAADQIQDVANPLERRQTRRDFAPVQTRPSVPVYDAQPPVVQRDDLLNKLRNLQGA